MFITVGPFDQHICDYCARDRLMGPMINLANEVVFCLMFVIYAVSALYSNQSVASLPISCSVTSYFSRMVVDVNCEEQLPDFSRMDFPLAPNVFELSVKKFTCRWVPKNVFQGLTGLQHLYIQSDKADHELQFEEGSLQSLPNLNIIQIVGNVIRFLPDGIFCHLPKVEKLYLENNSITTPEIMGFGAVCSSSYCPNNLNLLKLSDNSITHLRNRTFCSLNNLVYLDLSKNGLKTIDEDALYNLESLRVLDLSFNNLTSIPETTLKPLTGLYNLDLDSNVNLNITGFLKYVPQLKGLFLPGIGLEFIEKDAFKGLHRLESLMLYNNRLNTIQEDVFEPLIGVEDNVVNETAPTECDEDAVNRLVFGGEISFLNKKEAEVANITGLRYLNLNDNSFTVMPPISKLFKLLVFSISKNKIEYLQDDSFNSLRKLQRLALSFNKISYITHRIFANLKCLKQLLLDHNAIGYIDATAFDDLIGLSELHLQNNQIKDIHELFVKNVNLKLLNLSYNCLEVLSLEILPSSIIQLDVSHNLIKILAYTPGALQKQVLMEILDLSNNKINEITKTFFPLSLTNLFLHNNFIKNTKSCIFCCLSRIENVTLHNNQLETLHPDDLRINTLPVFQETPSVSLSGNNFICNCELQEMRNYVYNQSYLQILNLKNLLCQREYSKNKPNMIHVVQAKSPEDFLCRINHEHNTTLPRACSIFRDFDWEYVIVDCSEMNLTVIPSHFPPGVRKLYFDGNNVTKVRNFTFSSQVYRNLTELFLNNSHVQVIDNGTFIELFNLTHLNLQHNKLKYLSNTTFAGLHRLTRLLLSYNNLMVMEYNTFYPLSNLREIRLNHNHLRSFPIWNLNNSKSLSSISLSKNPWSCDCDYVQNYKEWLQDSVSIIVDINLLFCKFEDNSISEVPLIAFNSSHCYRLAEPSFMKNTYFPMTTGLISILVLFTTACLMLYIYRREMQVLIYSRYGVRFFHKNDAIILDRDKVYDAFLCYSNSDEDFVVDEIVPKLEGIEPPFRLCIHQRDFLVGGYITDNILEAVSKSRRSILVLSEAFVASEWCRFEFKTAYVQMLQDKCNRVIVVVLGDVPKQLDPEMKLYLKTNTYISWNDHWFWERLYFAMPDREQRQ